MLTNNNLQTQLQQPILSMPNSRFVPDNPDSKSSFKPQLNHNPESQLRGDKTKELSITIELSEETTSATFWDEDKNVCININIFRNDKYVTSLPSNLIISDCDHFLTKENASKTFPSKGIYLGFTENKAISSVFAVPLLGKNHNDLKLFDNKSDTVKIVSNQSKKSMGDISICFNILNSSNENVSFETNPQILVSLLILYWIDNLKKNFNTSQKNPKSNKRVGVNIVIPSYFTQCQRVAVIQSVKESHQSIRHIFPRALAAVAGALYSFSEKQTVKDDVNKSKLQDILDKVYKAKKNEPVVLFIMIKDSFFDVGVVKCEGFERARETGNLLGYERLVLLASGGACHHSNVLSSCQDKKKNIKSIEMEMVSNELKKVLSKCQPSTISAILHSGLDTKDLSYLSKVISDLFPGINMSTPPSIQLREMDVSTGGCLLAAAELESSKLYVPSKDKEGEWTILYCLPVGEEVVSTSIKLKEQLHDNAQIDELIYLPPNSRLWKADMGPVRQGVHKNPKLLRKYIWGPILNIFRKAPPIHYLPKWPKVSIVEVLDDNDDHKEECIQDITPLYEFNDDEGVMQECVLSMQMDANTGTVVISSSKKNSIRNMKSWYWFVFQITLSIVVIIGLILTFIYYDEIIDAYYYSLDSRWLKDFYEKNAPEKLKTDPLFIQKLMDKNKKQMFVLWRKLEKTYSVKWTPPYSIVENADL